MTGNIKCAVLSTSEQDSKRARAYNIVLKSNEMVFSLFDRVQKTIPLF